MCAVTRPPGAACAPAVQTQPQRLAYLDKMVKENLRQSMNCGDVKLSFKSTEQAGEVVGRRIEEDVQIQRDDRRAFELGCHPADDEEVDLVSDQDTQEAEEPNASGLGHAAAP